MTLEYQGTTQTRVWTPDTVLTEVRRPLCRQMADAGLPLVLEEGTSSSCLRSSTHTLGVCTRRALTWIDTFCEMTPFPAQIASFPVINSPPNWATLPVFHFGAGS